MQHRIDWPKYLIVLFITILLFVSASYISSYFGDKKVQELRDIQNQLSLNILSSETQYTLLSELSCKNVSTSVLSAEMEKLGARLEWSQKNLGDTDEVTYLRKYYSLLEIKDYLLMKRISLRCGVRSAFILYFYTNLENCTECAKQGIVLTALKEKYPDLRVYSFDYSTELSAVKAMLDIYKIKDTELPALILDDDLLTGFRSFEELEEMIQRSFKLKEAIEE